MHILVIEQLRTAKSRYQLFEKILLTSFSLLPTLYARHLKEIIPGNHQVDIINERYDPVNISEKYDVVIIHFSTASSYRAYEIADEFRNRGVCVILSGLHASAVPNEALHHADSVLLGRGEGNILDLLDDLHNNSLKKIYPPKSYDSYEIPQTRINLPGFVMVNAVEASRGCPYQCLFCPESNTPLGNSFFARPINEVVNEIKNIPQKIFMFYDASLTIDASYTKELFKLMIPLKKHFFCNGNVNVLSKDEELVSLSKQAGCIGWLIGFESISQQTIDAMGKKSNNISNYQKAVDIIHKYHMAVIGDFMFGFDTDLPTVFDDTLNVIRKLRIDVADFSILTPFPGTPLFDRFSNENRILTRDWKKYTMHSVVYEPKHMSPDELKKGVEKMYAEFYHPLYSLKRMIRSLQLGMFPFAAVFSRNMIAMIAYQKLLNNSE